MNNRNAVYLVNRDCAIMSVVYCPQLVKACIAAGSAQCAFNGSKKIGPKHFFRNILWTLCYVFVKFVITVIYLMGQDWNSWTFGCCCPAGSWWHQQDYTQLYSTIYRPPKLLRMFKFSLYFSNEGSIWLGNMINWCYLAFLFGPPQSLAG